jgi:hypothetical protein
MSQPPLYVPTVRDQFDFFQAHGDAGPLRANEAFYRQLQDTEPVRLERLAYFTVMPADLPALVALRIALSQYGGYNLAGLRAARDVVSQRRRLPFAEVHAMTLAEFVEALTPSAPTAAAAESSGPRPPTTKDHVLAVLAGRKRPLSAGAVVRALREERGVILELGTVRNACGELKRAGRLRSVRGPNGGYQLARPRTAL